MRGRRLSNGLGLEFERLSRSAPGRLIAYPPADSFVLLSVQRGSGALEAAGAVITVAAGMVVVLEPGCPAAPLEFRPDAGVAVAFRPENANPRSGAERRELPFPGDARWATAPSPNGAARAFVVAPSERISWEARLDLLALELEERRPGSVAAARAQLTGLLIGVSRLALGTDGEAPRSSEDALEVIAVIDARYRQPLSLEDVARAVGRSPRHLSRLVRDVTGQTVMYWIDERRMAEARRLLLETDATVEEVAIQSGYSESGYFRRRFRRSHGLSPTHWRGAHRGSGQAETAA